MFKVSTTTNDLTFRTIAKDVAIKAALAKKPADVVNEITDSGLKGRGGAGFPTGLKWSLAAAAKADEKWVICNADEGEPGTFKDRLILQEFPELLFEGMTIAGYAIGAQKGILYLRAEYTYMLKDLEAMLAKRREDKLLGQKILGKDFAFDIEIRMGAGAYVCGEESALIESIEGHRGEPRNRPPFPVEFGLNGDPTIVNNVESLCWAASIMAKGADWFKTSGTEKSRGRKLLSISGDCEKPGVYEFPFGVTIKEILSTVGSKDAKAIQVGGASGNCIPLKAIDRKIAFEDVSTGGSVIIFGKDRDMLRVAQNFLEFFVEESCGQCTPCREGNPVLLKGVELLEHGKCSMKYLNELRSLGETMQLACKCGLGQSSPNAFLTIVEHFKDEIMGRTSMSV